MDFHGADIMQREIRIESQRLFRFGIAGDQQTELRISRSSRADGIGIHVAWIHNRRTVFHVPTAVVDLFMDVAECTGDFRWNARVMGHHKGIRDFRDKAFRIARFRWHTKQVNDARPCMRMRHGNHNMFRINACPSLNQFFGLFHDWSRNIEVVQRNEANFAFAVGNRQCLHIQRIMDACRQTIIKISGHMAAQTRRNVQFRRSNRKLAHENLLETIFF